MPYYNCSADSAEQCSSKIDAGSLAIELDYVAQAQIISSRIRGLTHKTVLIDFVRPLSVISSLAGFKQRIGGIGNHYLPPASWGRCDEHGLAGLHHQSCRVLDRPPAKTCLLFTGVDVDYLSVQKQQYRETKVLALVTAGVKSNAAHMVKDRGNYHEPGTINIILLSNRTLCPRAMTQALIVATEAKAAALSDLDIRSSFIPAEHMAMGTGTDGVLVAQGCGTEVDYPGGHTKIGELFAKAVYAGAKEAVSRWDGLTSDRSILARLQDRRISLPELIGSNELAVALEELLLEPRYAGFLATALTLCDDYQAGLVPDVSAFEQLSRQLATEVAGEQFDPMIELINADQLPPLLRSALNALAGGLRVRLMKRKHLPSERFAGKVLHESM